MKSNMQDDLKEKLHEYEEAVSTIRWELFEEKGVYKRNDITNLDYINYMKGNLKTLELGQASLESERQAMRGANDEFYVFHHINDVPWDAWGELLQTEEVEKLKRINRIHLGKRNYVILFIFWRVNNFRTVG